MTAFKIIIGVLCLIFGGITSYQFFESLTRRKFDIIWFPQAVVQIIAGLFLLGIV